MATGKLLEFNISELSEGRDVEFKLAAGPSGRSKLPDDFFKTYSAMANTAGGMVFLGVAQVDNDFEVRGVEDPDKVIRAGLKNGSKLI